MTEPWFDPIRFGALYGGVGGGLLGGLGRSPGWAHRCTGSQEKAAALFWVLSLS